MDFLKNFETIFVNFLFSLFWTYNYYVVIIEEKLRPYGASDIVKRLFFINDKKVEPELDKWNCTAVVNMNLAQPKMIEQYEYGNDDDFLSLNRGDYSSPIYLKKCDDYTLSRVTYTKPPQMVETSAARFLNIMYFNKKMAEPIKLTLDPRFMRVGNEIFSKTFVLRMLSYQYNPSDYLFDNAYELHIMDGRIQKVTLKSNQFLLFTKEWYEIITDEACNEEILEEPIRNEVIVDEELSNEELSNEELSNEELSNEELSNEVIVDEDQK
jgi:hypothetical protein